MIVLILIFGMIIIVNGSSPLRAPKENQKKENQKKESHKEETAETMKSQKKEKNDEKPENTEKVVVIPTLKKEPESEKEAAPKAQDTGTAPATQSDDVSDGSKFKTYNNYENAALAKQNSNTIYQLSQLYFKDGLYERAVNLSKKDLSGDIRNLYVVAIGSRLMGNYDQAIDYYNRILAVSPNQSEAKLGIGISYKGKGEFSKALGYLREYSRTNSNSEVTKEIAILNELISSK